jgi:hypothetical protein
MREGHREPGKSNEVISEDKKVSGHMREGQIKHRKVQGSAREVIGNPGNEPGPPGNLQEIDQVISEA